MALIPLGLSTGPLSRTLWGHVLNQNRPTPPAAGDRVLNPAMAKQPGRPVNSCHRCGCTSYRPVIARDAQGAMRVTDNYVCTNCKFQFTRVEDWRDGPREPTGGKGESAA